MPGWSIVGSNYESYIANLLLRDRHWQTELLVESLWWSFKELSQHSNISKVSCLFVIEHFITFLKVMHIWGTPVYLGTCLVKLCTSEEKGGLKLYSLLDTIQLEWSNELAEFLLSALK